MKSLVIFTSRFPYPPGEEFLMNEVDELAKYFTSVQILPMNHVNAPKKQVPKNVEVLTAKRGDGKFLRTIKLIADFQSLSWMIKELPAASKHGIKAILKLVNWTAVTSEIKRNIQSSTLIPLEDETVFYSYWLTPSATALAMLKEKYPDIKAVSRVHGGDLYLERHSPAYLPFQGKVIRTLDQTISISENGREYLNKLHPDVKKKISVSRLGTKNEYPYQNKGKSTPLKLVSCSYLKPVKRIHLLVEALKSTHSPIEWTHIGDGPERRRIEALVKELPDNIVVHFLGNLNNKEVIQQYQTNSYDLFINVSESEGIPVTIMEAFSFGIPVVATNVGGTSELVNQENGYLLQKDFPPKELAKILEDYVQLPPEFSQQKSLQAYKTWDQHYNAVKNYNKFADLLKGVSKK
jgi:glycosyltransferase involved in cell wall biosynthesis